MRTGVTYVHACTAARQIFFLRRIAIDRGAPRALWYVSHGASYCDTCIYGWIWTQLQEKFRKSQILKRKIFLAQHEVCPKFFEACALSFCWQPFRIKCSAENFSQTRIYVKKDVYFPYPRILRAPANLSFHTFRLKDWFSKNVKWTGYPFQNAWPFHYNNLRVECIGLWFRWVENTGCENDIQGCSWNLPFSSVFSMNCKLFACFLTKSNHGTDNEFHVDNVSVNCLASLTPVCE